jgi:hypothetical protein
MRSKTKRTTKQTRRAAAARSSAPVQPGLGDFGRTAKRESNISMLARETGMDRATITKRLDELGVKKRRVGPKETRVDHDEALMALQNPDGLRDARRKKLTAETALTVLKLQRERGEFLTKEDVRAGVFELIKAMHFRFVKAYPRDNARRLQRLRTAAELERTLSTDFSLMFDELKNDNLEFLT